MTDELINAIIEIANHKRVIEHLEPNIFWHEEIKPYIVKRVLYSYFLLMEAENLHENTGGTIPKTFISDQGAVCSYT